MKNLNRIHLSGLRAVEAVGRLGTLREAADELGVTPGAVSQQILKVEQQIGRSLFERLPKGLQLTPLGEQVQRRLTSGMSELSAGLALALRQEEKTLTVSVAPVFAEKWLVWRLKRFNKQHPDIRIRVDATIELVDPDLSDIDICIRVGQEPANPNTWTKLLDHRVFPVCSPALAKQIGSPADLAKVPIVRDSGEMFSWNTWLKPNGLDEDVLGPGPTYSDGSLCLDAAIAGQGVFLAWETLACDALRFNRLVAPFPDRYATKFAYWLVVGRHRRTSQRVRNFEAWLKTELKRSMEEACLTVPPG